MYGILWRVYGSLFKEAIYVSVGQTTGSLGQSTAVYRKSTAVYGCVGEATGSPRESTVSKVIYSQVLGGLVESLVV